MFQGKKDFLKRTPKTPTKHEGKGYTFYVKDHVCQWHHRQSENPRGKSEEIICDLIPNKRYVFRI